uniref:Protein argonaute N-terminal domain-containing protein n=1 Tax=Trichuris muris TaxID=70415 RepID=A0A5S6QFW4_TRIMR
MDARLRSQSSVRSGCNIVATIPHPGYGKIGDTIDLVTNFVELRKAATSDVLIWQYEVKITGKAPELMVEDKQNAFWDFVQQRPNIFKDPNSLAFNGEVCIRLFSTNVLSKVGVEIRQVGLTKLAFKKPLYQTLSAEKCHKPIEMVNVILSQSQVCPLTEKAGKFCTIDGIVFKVASKKAVALNFGVEARRGLYMKAGI